MLRRNLGYIYPVNFTHTQLFEDSSTKQNIFNNTASHIHLNLSHSLTPDTSIIAQYANIKHVFTGSDHPVASELPINGDTTVARSNFTNVYRMTKRVTNGATHDESFLAYQVPTTNSMTTYAFDIDDIDDEYSIDGNQVGTTLTPHGTIIGARLDHPSSKIDLDPGNGSADLR
jgi:hypothetical protein